MPRLLVAALLTVGLTAPAFAQVEAALDAPVMTAPRPVRPAPPVSAVAPRPTAASLSAPSDDYGYVAWCFGAVSGYVDQYENTMPEVIRIERAFPTPSTEDNIAKVYPEQRDAAKASLLLYRDAMTAAEKASPRAINQQGAQALNRGRAIWNGYASVTKAQLAQFWMGWTPPADCDTRAKSLKAKSELFGQALTFNAQPVPEPVAEPIAEPVAEPVAVAAADPAPAPAAAPAAPSMESLLTAAASGQGASADLVAVAAAAPAPARAAPAAPAPAPARAARPAPSPARSSMESLLNAAASGQGASADLVLRGRQ